VAVVNGLMVVRGANCQQCTGCPRVVLQPAGRPSQMLLRIAFDLSVRSPQNWGLGGHSVYTSAAHSVTCGQSSERLLRTATWTSARMLRSACSALGIDAAA